MTNLETVLQFLTELERRKISYRLEHDRDEALMVRIDVPGQRWEVEFLADGEIWVEIFDRSSGVSTSSLEELLKRLAPYSD
jgi:hypothetical protein